MRTGANVIKHDPWFLQERASAFASLVLTKQHDVAVRPYAGRDVAIDLLVEILKDGKATMRFFGVQLIAYLDLPPIQNADERVLSHLGRDPFEADLPLCVFVIGVRKPEGLYRWVMEPVVDGGRAHLRHSGAVAWQPLDEAGVGRLIDQVKAWYDALNDNSVPKQRGRHAAK
jgi:hypothetical protein